MTRGSVRTRGIWIVGALFVALVMLADARAQAVPAAFTLQSTEPSQFVSGCVGPSTCLCFAVFISEVTGVVDLTLDPLSMGPLFDYDLDVALTFPDTATTIMRFGSGSLIYDSTDGDVLGVLDIDIDGDGVDETYTTIGFVPAPSFPTTFALALYSPEDPLSMNPCTYNGIELTLSGTSTSFVRGDANDDGSLNIADPIRVLEHLFSGVTLDCERAADIDDSGELNLVDPLALLGHLFVGGPPPSAPYPDCGVDTTPDSLSCANATNCVP